MKNISALLISILAICFHTAHAYNIQQISFQNGLTSSAVRFVAMDSYGFMWYATYDGLNRYDGLSVKSYMPTSNPNSLPGNVIRHITETEPGMLWLKTNQGLCLFNSQSGTFQNYPDMRVSFWQAKSPDGTFFVLSENDSIAVYNKSDGTFHNIHTPGIKTNRVWSFTVCKDDIIWVFRSREQAMRYKIIKENGIITGTYRLMDYEHEVPIRWAFEKGTDVVFVDTRFDLYTLDINTGVKEFVINIASEVPPNESLRDAVIAGNDIFFAFINDGLKVIRRDPEARKPPYIERTTLNYGVFSLAYDPVQQIVLVGTDGYGVYIYSEEDYTLRSSMLYEFYPQTKVPVRSVMLDADKNLWIGTKGDGLFCFPNYNPDEPLPGKEMNHFHIQNSSLANNSIFSLVESKHNLLWIVSGGPGLNYYSYADKRIHKLQQPPGSKALHFLNSVIEQDANTLWVLTSGEGLHRVKLTVTNEVPCIKSVEQFRFFQTENVIYDTEIENDSILWIGSRGDGLVRFNLKTEEKAAYLLENSENQLVNDILVVYRDSHERLWLGTSFGLCRIIHVGREKLEYTNYNTESGLPNNTIHGITEDLQGCLWLSTNRGLSRFDPRTNVFTNYTNPNDLRVLEFSDIAYYKCPRTGIMFFGGIDGFVSIRTNEIEMPAFTPNFYFNSLSIYGNEVAIADYIKTKDQKEVIELSHNQNFFTVSFVAPDYVNGHKYTYQYLLSGHSDKWIDNGTSNSVTFTNMAPGEYLLKVRYSVNNIFEEQPVYTQYIRILPPWYMSTLAYIIYVMVLGSLGCFLIVSYNRRVKSKQQRVFEKMEQKKTEEIYESKLRFFTNITHEFSTPLTLIYGPCDHILSSVEESSPVYDYALLIRRNAERLNGLIQELIEFRRIDTGHTQVVIEKVAIEEFAGNILSSFRLLADSKQTNYVVSIEKRLMWQTDTKCYMNILTNLVSNAFKYTPDGGNISVDISVDNQMLVTTVSNTGKGFRPEDIPFIFDRYYVLDNLESRHNSRLFSRNGLGLSICHSTVKLLGGDMDVESIPGQTTRFTVKLPMHELTEKASETSRIISGIPLQIPEKKQTLPPQPDIVKSRPTILVVDDEVEILWFVCEILKDQYNVIPVNNPVEIEEILSKTKINLLITDVIMPAQDSFGLVRRLKESLATSHIPVIMLSGKTYTEDQLEGLDAGVDMYISKPFDVQYLKKAVRRLLKREEETKEYYNSALSAFEITEGQIVHREDKEFYERALRVIDENIKNPSFTTEELAALLNVSVRQLYRKIDGVYKSGPGSLIRDYKLKIAEGLLIKTNISVDEVIYQSGFNNRGSFYKLFSQRYGMPPKAYREKNSKGE
ncbi:hybrid sensor histidine kinase/response regulator transcription factor [Bacteroides sp. 519]|uniref:hybrid sensor histidine kinase/response regulator transcription factor n=1 Tax=Bacteroides sp. 519 TaxID=2302937 RepID=UPI0013D117DD|nr:hybrid sensor histidine kinase/response regulator transcription factor [Bacteroides sp. 519]